MILAIPFGTDRATAERAYSHRSRLARKGELVFSVEDVNWAMNQVEAHLDDPTTSAGTYRLPAHPEALRRPNGHGLFRPPLLALPRRTPPSSPEQLSEVLAEARTDALDHLLSRAALDVKRKYGLGGDVGAIRPAPIDGYPRRARSKVPIVVTLVTLAVVGIGVLAFLYFREKALEIDATAPTTTTTSPPVVTTVAPTTLPSVTTLPPLPGLGDRLVREGIALTPVQPIDAFGHLCLLFIVSGDPPLNFVPVEAVLVADQVIQPALDVNTGRASSEVVFGELEPTSREVCWPIVDWREQQVELLYTLNDVEYRWTISDSGGA